MLNNLVSAYFDLVEINDIEEKTMKIHDYTEELDNILKSTGRKFLSDAGKIRQIEAVEKAKTEF